MAEIKDVSYCVGVSMGQSLMAQNLNGLDVSELSKGIQEALEGKDLKFSPEQANEMIGEYIKAKQETVYAVNKEEGAKFLEENSKKDGVTTLESGLQYEIITEGTGEKAGPESNVTTHYHGTLINGDVFDSSVERGQPASFGVNQVIKGWTEALQLMPVGSKWKLFVPEHLAYGANPHPEGPIKPYMTLIFDVELISVN